MVKAESASLDISTAANGFALVSTHSRWQRCRIVLLLTFLYGFWRQGGASAAEVDSRVYRDFRRGNLRIMSGYDIWIGYDFLAGDPDSDEFLRRFYARHCRH